MGKVARMPVKHAVILTLSAAAVLALGSCGKELDPSEDDDEILVAFSLSGGIAGVDTRLVVYRDGAATVHERGSEVNRFRLTKRGLEELVRLFAAVRFTELQANWPGEGISDEIMTEIQYLEHRVRFESTADVPGRLRCLAGVLSDLATTGTRQSERVSNVQASPQAAQCSVPTRLGS